MLRRTKKNLWQMDEKIKNEMSYSKIQWKIHTKKRTSVDKTNRLFGSEDSHSFDAICFPAWIILRFSLRNTKLDNKSHNYEIKPYYNIFMYWLSVFGNKNWYLFYWYWRFFLRETLVMPNNMTTISCDSLDHFFLSKNELIKKKKEVIIFQFIRWLGHFNEEEKKNAEHVRESQPKRQSTNA